MTVNNTYITYFGDSSTTTFSIPFRYNKKAEVVVLVNSVDFSGKYTFLNDQTIKFNNAPLIGDAITIKRETDIVTPEIVWKNGSNTTSAQLNIMVRQLINGLQEAKDTAERGIFADVDGTFDFHRYRIKNLSDPVNPGDAATKQWVETGLTSSLNQAKAASAAAQSFADLANSYKNAASGSVTQAASHETNAKQARTGAETAKAGAETAQSSAQSAKASSEAARDLALSYRNAAQTAKAEAETAQAASQVAKASSEAARDLALSYQNAAQTAKAGAETAQAAAEVAANSAIMIAEGEGYLTKGGNLSGLANKNAARLNLGLGSAAIINAEVFNTRANNLNDVADASTARSNLGLGSAAIQNDSRYLKVSGNLSDLENGAAARNNLGLGEAATRADSYYLKASNNLSEISSTSAKVTARFNLGLDKVDNTSDADKPVSTAVATALSGKAGNGHTHTIANVSGLQDALNAKASNTSVDDRVYRIGVKEYSMKILDKNTWTEFDNQGWYIVGLYINTTLDNIPVASRISARRIVQNVPSLGGWTWVNIL